jgi:hypothetical protein
MRTALIFTPQWDPRQPPLAPAVLAGALRSAGADVKVFDLNIALYQRLLRPAGRHGIEDFLLKRLCDPHALSNAESYLQACQQAQRLFDERFDPHGSGRLFWDTCGGLPSTAASQAWQTVMNEPDQLPFVRHLADEIAVINEWQPDIICFSVISDTQLAAALSLAALFRSALPESRIIFGGSALTYRRSLLAGQAWLRSTIDAICLGDGEPLMAALAADASLSELPNSLSWNDDGKPHIGPSLLYDMATPAPPDFSDFALHNYLTPHLVIPVETARGCPWGRCAFCVHPVRAAGGRPLYRPKPLKLVENELKNQFASGHRRFMIVDEALPPLRLRELSDLFAALPEPVTWIGYARLDAGHTRDGFIRARAAGCHKLFIGVESGSDRILKRFNKGVDAARARRVLLDAAAAGLAVHAFLMTGFPGEDESDRQATLDLLADVWPAFDPFGISFDLFPLTGELETDLIADPPAYGWQIPLRDSRNDLAWQFPLLSGAAAAESLIDFRSRIHALADSVAGPEFGLRHAGLAQDCLHLLLLEAGNLKSMTNRGKTV